MTVYPPASVRQGKHYYRVRVYYEDTDAGGVVYHATYLGMAERARTEALRDLDVPHAEMARQHGLIFMVRRVILDYLAPARLDDSLVIVTELQQIRNASVELRQSFFLAREDRAADAAAGEGERPLVVADVRLVCVRLADVRPSRVPDRWRAALARLAPEARVSQA